jgi:hypothetical protein
MSGSISPDSPYFVTDGIPSDPHRVGCLLCGARRAIAMGSFLPTNENFTKRTGRDCRRVVTYLLCDRCYVAPRLEQRVEEVLLRALSLH